MITKENIMLFLKNTFLYTAIVLGCLFLYNYSNKSVSNIPHTDFSFVYAQF